MSQNTPNSFPHSSTFAVLPEVIILQRLAASMFKRTVQLRKLLSASELCTVACRHNLKMAKVEHKALPQNRTRNSGLLERPELGICRLDASRYMANGCGTSARGSGIGW